MLLQGLTLTIVGMSVVFTFLTLLVFVMKLLSAFLPKYFPDVVKVAKVSIEESTKIQNQSSDTRNEIVNTGETEIAAVIAAVRSYSHS